MSQRFSLFYAGFCVSAPALYYNQLQLTRKLESEQDERTRLTRDELVTQAEDLYAEQVTNLKTAESIAQSLEVTVPALPQDTESYFAWAPKFVDVFEQSFPMSRIDHYYFLFGRKLSELIVNQELAALWLDVQSKLDAGPELARNSDKFIKDNEYILFKLIAPAALLSSEPRHNYFNVLYKDLNAAFDPFRGIDTSTMVNSGRDKLSGDLRAYGQKAREGFKGCISLLKELGV